MNDDSLREQVIEASRLMRAREPAERQAGRALLVALSQAHGHAAVEAAQAEAGLLPEGHMAYWSRSGSEARGNGTAD